MSNFAPVKVTLQPRKTRSDKCHDIKFPVTYEQRLKIRQLAKQLSKKHGKQISPTKMATLLLLEGLQQPRRLRELEYVDTKQYMHVKPTQMWYQEIEQLAILLDLSERKTVHRIVISILNEKYTSLL